MWDNKNAWGSKGLAFGLEAKNVPTIYIYIYIYIISQELNITQDVVINNFPTWTWANIRTNHKNFCVCSFFHDYTHHSITQQL